MCIFSEMRLKDNAHQTNKT